MNRLPLADSIRRAWLCTLRRPAGLLFLGALAAWGVPGLFALEWSRDQSRPLAGTGATWGNVPIYFEANLGQTEAHVRFVARGADHGVYLGTNGATLVFGSMTEPAWSAATSPNRLAEFVTRFLRLNLLGANGQSIATGLEQRGGRVNYLLGNDPAAWKQAVPTYGRVRYTGVYPGIDLVYYGKQNQLEFDFHIAPGADPARIRIQFEGADKLKLDADGDLILQLGSGELRQHRPVIYQVIDGQRRPVEGRYRLEEAHTVVFELGRFDRQHELVIDPVLSYSTYLGGNKHDTAWAVRADAGGSAYVAGDTLSVFKTLPVSGVQTNFGGGSKYGGDAFVARLDPTGTNLVFLTYLGGDELDGANGLALDSSGAVYVTGFTDSTNFPTFGTAGVFQPAIGGTNVVPFNVHNADAFVTKLDTNGFGVYSTYLGGDLGETGIDIAVDSTGFAYIVGFTESSTNFPTMGALQATNAGNTDIFVTKLNQAGSALVYSTYLGGLARDYGTGIAVDGAGNATVCGYTESANFPVANALQPVLGGGRDVIVAKLNPAGSALIYATYLGGARNDIAYRVKLDAGGSAYVAGSSASVDFPSTPGALNKGGFFRSTDSGGSWTLSSTGLTHTIVQAVLADPGAAGVLYAGTPRGVFKSTDGGLNWALSSRGLSNLTVNTLVVDPATSSTIYAGTQGGIYRSVDSGLNWTNVSSGITAPAIRAVEFDPSAITNIYSGGYGDAFRSTNAAATWTKFHSGLGNQIVNALAIHPAAPSLLYAATEGGVYLNTNSATKWRAKNTGLKNKHTRALVIDPADPNTLYAGTAKGLFKSIDGATNWVLLTNGLGQPSVNVLLIDPILSSTVYAGTTNGIYKSLDAGISWASSQTNLTALDVTALAFDAASTAILYAGTRGTNFAGGTNDAFLAKLAPNGTSLTYAFTFGGDRNDEAWDVAVDTAGNAFVTGQTASKKISIGGLVNGARTNLIGKIDAFLAEFDPTGSSNVFFTYFGGTKNDIGQAIALDPAGGIYVAGRTESSNFSATNALQETRGGGGRDAFVAKFLPDPGLMVMPTAASVMVTWSAPLPEFVLESSVSCHGPWEEVKPQPVLDGNHHAVIVPASQGCRFFRLRKISP